MIDAGSWPDWIAALILLAGGLVGYGMLRQRIADLEKARGEDRDFYNGRHADLTARVAKAEEGANAVQGLAAAVEHLGERFGDQVKHLVETFGLKFDHLTSEMADLKTEVRKRRSPPARPKTKAQG